MKFLTRLATILSFLMMVNYANAQSNLVYMDQIGDGSIITFTQTGGGNRIGSSTNRADITGDNNEIVVEQIGNSNEADISLNGDANIINELFTGNSNILGLVCYTCSAVTLNDTVTGNGNEIQRIIDSANVVSDITIESDNNLVTFNNDSTSINGSTSSIEITGGNANIVDVTQTGVAGSDGHSLLLDIDGAANEVSIGQGGNVDSHIDTTITGSGNTVTINSNYSNNL